MIKEEKTKHSNSLFASVVKKLKLSGIGFKIMEHKPLFTMGDVFSVLKIRPEQAGKTISISVMDLAKITSAHFVDVVQS